VINSMVADSAKAIDWSFIKPLPHKVQAQIILYSVIP
jgi:hypothetical protein